MNTDREDIARWPDRLDAFLAQRCKTFRRAHVVAETDSTQNAVDRLGAVPGDVVVAGRQTAGRGRRGRSWSGGTDGAAITFVLEPGQTTHLSIALGVAAARAIEVLLERKAQLKWPNDVYVDGRKLAGVLVEQNERRALPAVGVNVHQQAWPEELVDTAISLAQLGCSLDRIDVIESVIAMFDQGWAWPRERLEEEFASRDLLIGSSAEIEHGQTRLSGEIVALRPFEGLTLRTSSGEYFAPAATTRIVSFTPPASP